MANLSDQQRVALWVSFITLVFVVIICLPVLINSENGSLTFALIGTRFSERDPDGTTGYDGQFAYFIARDGAEAVPHIDGPTLRYQRIVYPVLARILALGSENLVPWTLLTVNIIAHSVGAGLVTYLLAGFRAWPYWALIYSIWVGNLFAVRFDLNEPLCFALALAAVVTYRKQHFRWTIFLLMLSTLAKELGLVIAAGLALHAFLQEKWRWASLIFGGPLILFLSWWGVMRLWLGTFPTRYPAAKIHLIPLQGMMTVENPVELTLLALFLGIPTVFLLAAALYTLWKRSDVPLTAVLMLPAAGFVLVMPDVSWQDQVAAYRVGLPVVAAGILFVGQCFPRYLKWLAAMWIPPALIIFLIPGLWTGGS